MSNALRILKERKPKRAAVIVRHAERHRIVSLMDSMGVGLTDKGMEDALVFGRSLPAYRCINIFHSPALRCRQTAEQIALGLTEQGIASIMHGVEANLCAAYIKDEAACLGVAERAGNAFLRSWFEGGVDEALIYPPRQAADMVLRTIIPRLIDGDDESLDIHVSHDWDIMLLREQLLGPRPMDEGWLGFLDGLVFTRSPDGFRTCYNGSSGSYRWCDCRSISQ